MKKNIRIAVMLLIIGCGSLLVGCNTSKEFSSNEVAKLNYALEINYNCIVIDCSDETHAHFNCGFDDCSIIADHLHENLSCTREDCLLDTEHTHCELENCLQTGIHIHNNCGLDECLQDGEHLHNCDLEDCEQKGSHSHENYEQKGNHNHNINQDCNKKHH